MPTLLATLSDLFGCESDLYSVLGVAKTCPEGELKRAYHKRSLQWHPDRNPDDKEMAKKKFQALGHVYRILSDPDLRGLYDETGEVDDEVTDADDKDWDQYWRLLFKKISVDDIKKFEEKYRHSDEEMSDLRQAYLDGDGDMKYILDSVLCCTDDDEQRFNDIISDWISKEEVPHLKKFKKLTTKQVQMRKRKADKEAKEAEEAAKELGLNGSSLESMIMKRQEQRAKESDNFLDALAAKYANGGSGKKKANKKK